MVQFDTIKFSKTCRIILVTSGVSKKNTDEKLWLESLEKRRLKTQSMKISSFFLAKTELSYI